MKAIVNGKIVLPTEILEGKAILYNDKIRAILPEKEIPADAERVDAQGMYVTPGLIDIHIHGYMGADASDGKLEGIKTMAKGVAANGVSAFLPTTMTVSYDDLRKAFAQIRTAMHACAEGTWEGAEVAGVNSEGPFINVARKGAQAGEHVRVGDAAFLKENSDVIRVFTIAPEVEGNLDCIREIHRDTDIRISIGHTTADYAQTLEAFDAGVSHVTHLFNAQSGLHHRNPGVVGAALGDPEVSCELIADTFHVHSGLFGLLAEVKKDKLVLITDCTRAGGEPDGEYSLGGQPIFVKGIECRLADGTIAGSVLKMNEAVRNMLTFGKTTLPEAVAMASLNPARCVGLGDRKGSIEVGKDADFAFMDADLNVHRTINKGKDIYRA